MARRVIVIDDQDNPETLKAALLTLQAQGLTIYPEPPGESPAAPGSLPIAAPAGPQPRGDAQTFKRNRELTALYSVSSVLNQSLELNTLLQECLDRMLEAMSVETGGIILLDKSGSFRLGASRNMSEEFDALFSPLQIDYKLMHRVMGAGEVVIVEDLSTLTQLDQEMIRQSGYRSLVMGPLQAKDRILGGFVLASKREELFTAADTEFVLSIGKQVGMALQLGELYAELNETVSELRRANTRLEEATRHKSEFLANMSHELRTPLNAIIGFSELLQDQTFGPLNDKQNRYVENILNSGKHLLALVNDVLDLSKVEAGKMELQLDSFAPADIVMDVEGIVAGLAAKKKICLTDSFSQANPYSAVKIKADRGRLKQILYNLLSNAIKFTPEEGRVEITGQVVTRNGQEWLEISISDSGIGIRPEDQERIFEEFQMVDNTLSKRQQGTGLGLALSRRLARLHGGDIRVASALGKGSTFTLAMPVDSPAGEAAPTPAAPPTAHQAAWHLSPGEQLALVIEDEDQAAELLTHYLEQTGYRVVRCRSGEEALQQARVLRPAVISLDILLPHKNGWEVLRELKQDPETRDIPVVVVTVVDNYETSFALGAVACFVKPVRKDELIAKLNELQIQGRRKRIARHLEDHRESGEPLHALIIDDSPNDRELISAVLNSAGMTVVTAESGEQGWQQARQDPPDLVVLDIMMPGLDGFAVLRQLRQNLATLDVPVFVYTAKDLSAAEQKQLKQAEAVLQKGDFSGQSLLKALDRLQKKNDNGS